MYHLKTIVPNEDNITLPQCIYYLKNPNNDLKIGEEINISDQVKRFLKRAPNSSLVELEYRQNLLLQKLDVLYERIQAISTSCKVDVMQNTTYMNNKQITIPKEIVIVLNPGILPNFLDYFFKNNSKTNVTWHVHSSVPKSRSDNLKEIVENKLTSLKVDAQTNIRLIYKSVSASAELMTSPLHLPIIGVVNIIRYLCLLFPSIIQYDQNDHYVDSLLDQCCLLEKAPKKNEIVNKIFSQYETWIYNNELCIVDIVAYIVVKWLNITKLVPKTWHDKCKTRFF